MNLGLDVREAISILGEFVVRRKVYLDILLFKLQSSLKSLLKSVSTFPESVNLEQTFVVIVHKI